ncbi:hypothetical protein [Methylobacterium nodulans]|uniref:Uncharacterized protein n=1 Tax=Methylobacterium nodulans (strain LMG 21967 / CNCM I-2342 / ORS 2060) TaxID=460265 RepID=B8ISD1_METNO|nr:hypothetical protein [Methylobacterium nodulans]ACL58771.1 conserved hypothetical protein [Methylobacterium nodulans ORS 2060]
MLRLAPSSEPYWLDLLPGVRVRVRPVTVAMMLAAREAVSKVIRGEDRDDLDLRTNIALVGELARRAIIEWEGVGDADGVPVPATPETIDLLMTVWAAFDEFDSRYVIPALKRDAEKNASSSSPPGTSAGETNTAPPAA